MNAIVTHATAAQRLPHEFNRAAAHWLDGGAEDDCALDLEVADLLQLVAAGGTLMVDQAPLEAE